MQNSPQHDSLNTRNWSREETIKIVKEYWSSAIGCQISDFAGGITYVPDSTNPRLSDVKIKEEVYILNYQNGGTIVAVPDECLAEISEIISNFGFDTKKIGDLLLKRYTGELSYPATITLYLFSDRQLRPKDENVRELNKSELEAYNDFMEKCSEEDKKEVYMDFIDPFHVFYAYRDGDEIVAIGNYCRNNDSDKVAHIGILVRTDLKGRGYGKLLANTMTHKILEQGLVPQYRVDPKNIASRNIAKSLGYEEVLSGYSLRVKQNNA